MKINKQPLPVPGSTYLKWRQEIMAEEDAMIFKVLNKVVNELPPEGGERPSLDKDTTFIQ